MNSKKGAGMLNDKVILLTGGTGSFGQKFTEVILSEYNPKVVRIFSRDEFKQMQMRQRFNNHKQLRFFIGDVRDKNRLHRAMNGVDIVVHAAALKQVPSCEYNPIEAVKTNINGAANVVDAAIDNGVERVMAISTDKAVHPVNLYGATKLVAEKLFIQGNSYTGGGNPEFSCARYGNVVGSRGSVIPLFLKQREEGTISMTDKRMTRFWITIEQGINFVIKCTEMMQGGEVFVPKIPSMKVIDLAEVIAPQAQKKIIGIRPGEKINEILLTQEEARHAVEFNDFFVIEPEHPFWKKENFKGGRQLPEGFEYTSGNNPQWLTKKDLVELVRGL